METLGSIAELRRLPGPVSIAVGVFDGVHLGHRAVLRAALDSASGSSGVAVALTFDPHPSKILRPGQAARLLTSTRHKLALIGEMGFRHVLVVPFDQTFAAVPAEDFVRQLHGECGDLRAICVGEGWRFGHGRAGDVGLLERLGTELGYSTVEVAPVRIGETVVSSTLIREAIASGDLNAAESYLGRRYAVLGTVIKGDGRGRQLGFPTANLSAHNEQFPSDGVYAVRVQVGCRTLPGVANIGTRPTLYSQGERLLEVHLPGFSGDLYDQDLGVEFVTFLRGEQKFASLDDLRGQIAKDVVSALAVI